MKLLYILLVLLFITRLFGELSVRLKLPVLVGELIAGVFLGILVQHYSSALPILSSLTENEVFTSITDLAVFFLMLLAGVEISPRSLVKQSKKSFNIAIGGILLPLILGFGLAWLWLPKSELLLAQALFLGVALAITAVPVSISVLYELKQLNTKVGTVIIGAAIIDDILSLVLLALLTSIAYQDAVPSGGELATLLGKVTLFFLICFVLGKVFMPKLDFIIDKVKIKHIDFSLLIGIGLALALLAEKLQMHYIVGAFAAGLLFTRKSIDQESYDELLSQIKTLTFGFFAPIFFASIGLHLKLVAFTEIPVFLFLIILIAFIGKFFGAGVIAYLNKFTLNESLAIGSGMNSRGAVELIVANVALGAGILSKPKPLTSEIEYLFSAVVIMAIVTTIVSPILLRYFLSR